MINELNNSLSRIIKELSNKLISLEQRREELISQLWPFNRAVTLHNRAERYWDYFESLVQPLEMRVYALEDEGVNVTGLISLLSDYGGLLSRLLIIINETSEVISGYAVSSVYK